MKGRRRKKKKQERSEPCLPQTTRVEAWQNTRTTTRTTKHQMTAHETKKKVTKQSKTDQQIIFIPFLFVF
jgi:hypothetical protein